MRIRAGAISLILLLLSCCSPSLAENDEFTIVTEPSGAKLIDQYGNELGQSGNPVYYDLSGHGSTLEVTVSLPGYEPKLERIKIRQLRESKRYPPTGAIALRATSAMVTVKGFANKYKGLVAVGIVLGLVGGGVGLTRHRRTKRQLVRAQFLETLTAKAEELGDPFMGQRLGRFRLAELLGEGGTARVYRGLPDETLGDQEAVAVKVLNPESQDDPEFEQRFRREVTIWKDLVHPNIVAFLDWDRQDGVTYLVTELLPGQTLREDFNKGAKSAPDAVKLLKPILKALAHAHGLGVVHRDLKPENILLTAQGKPKVADFGLARISADDKITKTGTWVGTPRYMSPEQVQGATLDPRTDQYALGVMLYELVNGEPPFTGDDQVAIIFKQVSSAPPDLLKFHPDLPSGFCAAVHQMLAKSPEDRFGDLEKCLIALEASVG